MFRCSHQGVHQFLPAFSYFFDFSVAVFSEDMMMTSTLLETTDRSDAAERLVRAAQAGDQHAFGRLMERYQRTVYAAVYRHLGNDAETQEVCQEVFLRALRKIGQLRDPRCFGGWLRSIAGRMAINRVVRRKPLLSVSGVFDAVCAPQATPLGDMLARERQRQVQLGLGRLRSLDRETLVAFYFDGRTLLEMSDQFHSPVGTIKRRLHVARKRLAEELASLASA
jgi:RNA polymerase sigma-70 factor (ECF subfamily)